MLRTLLVATVLAACTTGAFAQELSWKPVRPIQAVVPFAAGSATDGVARIVLDEVSRRLGQPIIIENRAGASGTLGAQMVARSEPDGYTLLVAASSHTVTPSTFSRLPYDAADDFIAVLPLVSIPNVIVVNAKRDYRTAKDLAEDAKKRPGAMNYASAGVGSATHLAAERFKLSAGISAQHVPFKGSTEAISEILSDRIDFYASPANAAISLIREGRLRALAVSSNHRASVLPDVPTTVQAGFPESDYEFWVGVLLPKNTPKSIVDTFYTAIHKSLAEPNLMKKLTELGADPLPLSQSEFAEMIKKEIRSNAAVVKAAGIARN